VICGCMAQVGGGGIRPRSRSEPAVVPAEGNDVVVVTESVDQCGGADVVAGTRTYRKETAQRHAPLNLALLTESRQPGSMRHGGWPRGRRPRRKIIGLNGKRTHLPRVVRSL
jgi:hypothetical protein